MKLTKQQLRQLIKEEIVNIVGDEAAWNEMNALQRESLAKALIVVSLGPFLSVPSIY